MILDGHSLLQAHFFVFTQPQAFCLMLIWSLIPRSQTRRRLFHEAFAFAEGELSMGGHESPQRPRRPTSAGGPGENSRNPAVNLLSKLIAVLEHVETLPLTFTEPTGPCQNLQVCHLQNVPGRDVW